MEPQIRTSEWNLVDNKELDYHYLGDFDRDMLKVIKSEKNFNLTPVQEIWHNDGDQVLAFMRGNLIFVFNFSPLRSFTDYGFLVPKGSYIVALNSDSKEYGGYGFADDSVEHLTNFDPLYAGDGKEWLKLYIPARSAVVLRRKTSVGRNWCLGGCQLNGAVNNLSSTEKNTNSYAGCKLISSEKDASAKF
jgi:1,4-alpha-glucan branching enzyme